VQCRQTSSSRAATLTAASGTMPTGTAAAKSSLHDLVQEVRQRPTWGVQQPGEAAVEEGTESGRHCHHHSPGGGHGPPMDAACPPVQGCLVALPPLGLLTWCSSCSLVAPCFSWHQQRFHWWPTCQRAKRGGSGSVLPWWGVGGGVSEALASQRASCAACAGGGHPWGAARSRAGGCEALLGRAATATARPGAPSQVVRVCPAMCHSWVPS
jgi:hypothetical protein